MLSSQAMQALEQLSDQKTWLMEPLRCLQLVEPMLLAAAAEAPTPAANAAAAAAAGSSSSNSTAHPSTFSTFEQLLAALQPAIGNGPCTAVWTAGTLAYRCKTCAVSSSSAVCVACFKAGGHENHDYIMYRSVAGGCCDCGDVSSWRAEGCCPAHSPCLPQGVQLPPLPPRLAELLLPLLRLLLLQVVLLMEGVAKTRQAGVTPSSDVRTAAHRMVQHGVIVLCWLQPLAKITRIRSMMCEAMLLPAEQLGQPPPPTAATPAAAGSNGGSSGSSTDALQQGLWRVVQGFVPLLSAPSTGLCRSPGQESCLVRRLLLLLPKLAPGPSDARGTFLTEAVTLLLLLLYDSLFKFGTTTHLLDCYDWLLQLVGSSVEVEGEALSAALDRLTVQLFNAEATTVRLVKEQQLLQQLLTTARALAAGITCNITPHHKGLPPTPEAAAAAQMTVTAGYRRRFGNTINAYRRVLSDLSTVFHHASVAELLLQDPQLMQEHLLPLLEEIQGVMPYRRVVAGDMAPTTQQVLATANLEIVAGITLLDFLSAVMQSTPHQPAAAGAAANKAQQLQHVVLLLLGASQTTAAAAADWTTQQKQRQQQQQHASSTAATPLILGAMQQLLQHLATTPLPTAAMQLQVGPDQPLPQPLQQQVTAILELCLAAEPSLANIIRLCLQQQLQRLVSNLGGPQALGLVPSDQLPGTAASTAAGGLSAPASQSGIELHGLLFVPGAPQDITPMTVFGALLCHPEFQSSMLQCLQVEILSHDARQLAAMLQQRQLQHLGLDLEQTMRLLQQLLLASHLFSHMVRYHNRQLSLQLVRALDPNHVVTGQQQPPQQLPQPPAQPPHPLQQPPQPPAQPPQPPEQQLSPEALAQQREQWMHQIDALRPRLQAAMQQLAAMSTLQQPHALRQQAAMRELAAATSAAAAAAAGGGGGGGSETPAVTTGLAADPEATHTAASAASSPAAASASTTAAAIEQQLLLPSGLEDASLMWPQLLDGSLQASMHLPLQRFISFCMRGLMDRMPAAATAAAAAAAQDADGQQAAEQQQQQQSQVLARLQELPWSNLVHHVLLLQGWLAQVQGQLWVRNGDDVIMSSRLYFTSKEYLLEPDMLLLQCWLAAAAAAAGSAQASKAASSNTTAAVAAAGADKGVQQQQQGRGVPAAVAALLAAFGGMPLLQAAGLMGPDCPSAQSLLSALSDASCRLGLEAGLRLLVMLIRDRLSAGQSRRDRCRTLLLHWLAMGDVSYTAVVEQLPHDLQNEPVLIEELLSDLATFRQPQLGAAGTYGLKREHWKCWDPHFILYSRPELQRAQTRAGDLAEYQPDWQLTPPALQLPAFLAPLSALPAHNWVLRLLQYILASAVDDEPWGLSGAMTQQSESVTRARLGWSQQAARRTRSTSGSVGEGDAIMTDAGEATAATATATATAGPPPAAAAAAAGSGGGNMLQQMLHRLSSGRRRRRSSLASQGNQITEDMVMSALNLLSLGLHQLKQQLQQQQQQQGSMACRDSLLSKTDCEVLEQFLSADGVSSRSYHGPPLAHYGVVPGTAASAAGSSSQAAASSCAAVQPPPLPLATDSSSSSSSSLPGIAASLSALASGRIIQHGPLASSAGAAAAAAAVAGDGARLGSSSVVSDEIVCCCKALLPLAREVLGLVQAVLQPSRAANEQGLMKGGQGSAGTEETQDDGRKRAKEVSAARQEAALARMRAQQAAFLQAMDDMDEGSSEEETKETSTAAAAAAAAAASSDRFGPTAAMATGAVGSHGGMPVDAAAAATPAAGPASDSKQQQQLALDLASRSQSEAAMALAAAAAGMLLPTDVVTGEAGVGDSKQQQQQCQAVVCQLRQVPGECVVCREEQDSKGPLAYLAFVQVCGSMSTCMQPPPPWNKPINPSSSDYAALLPLAVSSSRRSSSTASAGRTPVMAPPAAAAGAATTAGAEAVSATEAAAAAAAIEAVGCGSRTASWEQHGVMYGKFDSHPGLHITSCGHMMHTSCWEKHRPQLTSQTALLQNRQLLCRKTPTSAHAQEQQLMMLAQTGVLPGAPAPATNEVLCPLCRRLCNFLLPAVTLDASEQVIQSAATTEQMQPLATQQQQAADGTAAALQQQQQLQQGVIDAAAPMETEDSIASQQQQQQGRRLGGYMRSMVQHLFSRHPSDAGDASAGSADGGRGSRRRREQQQQLPSRHQQQQLPALTLLSSPSIGELLVGYVHQLGEMQQGWMELMGNALHALAAMTLHVLPAEQQAHNLQQQQQHVQNHSQQQQQQRQQRLRLQLQRTRAAWLAGTRTTEDTDGNAELMNDEESDEESDSGSESETRSEGGSQRVIEDEISDDHDMQDVPGAAVQEFEHMQQQLQQDQQQQMQEHEQDIAAGDAAAAGRDLSRLEPESSSHGHGSAARGAEGASTHGTGAAGGGPAGTAVSMDVVGYTAVAGPSAPAGLAATATAAGTNQDQAHPQQQQQQQQQGQAQGQGGVWQGQPLAAAGLISLKAAKKLLPALQDDFSSMDSTLLPGLLWSCLGHGIAHWESQKRPLPNCGTFMASDRPASGTPGAAAGMAGPLLGPSSNTGSTTGAAAGAAAAGSSSSSSALAGNSSTALIAGSHAALESALLRSLQSLAALATVEMGYWGSRLQQQHHLLAQSGATAPHLASSSSRHPEQQQQQHLQELEQLMQQQRENFMLLVQWLSGSGEDPALSPTSSGGGSSVPCCVDAAASLFPAMDWPRAAVAAVAAAAGVGETAATSPKHWQVLQRSGGFKTPTAAPGFSQAACRVLEVNQQPEQQTTNVAGSSRRGRHRQAAALLQQQQQQQQQQPVTDAAAGADDVWASWAALGSQGDPWLLLLEVLAVALRVGVVPPSLLTRHQQHQQQQQQQHQPPPQQPQQHDATQLAMSSPRVSGSNRRFQAAAAAAAAADFDDNDDDGVTGADAAVWGQHPAELLHQLLLLLAPGAVAQSALWAVRQHVQSLPGEALLRLQQQLAETASQAAQNQQQQQQVLVVLTVLQAAVTLLESSEQAQAAVTSIAAGSSQPQQLTEVAAAAAAAAGNPLVEAIAAQLLPYLHRAYLLRQLLLQQAPSATLAESYSRVSGAAATSIQGLAAAAAAADGQAGSCSPSYQAQLVLTNLGLPSLSRLLQAALSGHSIRHAAAAAAAAAAATAAAAAATAPGGPSGGVTSAAAAAATAAGGGGGGREGGYVAGSLTLPPWMPPAMLQQCFDSLKLHCQQAGQAAAAAAAAAATTTAAGLGRQARGLSGPLCIAVPRQPCFMPLPMRYQDLYLSLSEMQCGACGQVPEQAGLCLVTGRWLCTQRHCPACIVAAGRQRRATLAPLLLLQGGGSTSVLMLRSSRLVAERLFRSTACKSPYRDQHGEDWSTHNWGRPLQLRPDVYGSLSGLWAAAGFDFDSYIVHHSQLVQGEL